MDKDIESIRIAAVMRTSKYEYKDNPAAWEVSAEIELRTHLAHTIQKLKSEKIETEDMVERRIDLYVATPDEFWRIVRKEAERIAMQFMPQVKF